MRRLRLHKSVTNEQNYILGELPLEILKPRRENLPLLCWRQPDESSRVCVETGYMTAEHLVSGVRLW